MKATNEELERWPNQERSTLWWSVCRAYAYVESNVGLLVNYGARYRKGLPIANSIAESAVNQVVSGRMAKKQTHTRESPELRGRFTAEHKSLSKRLGRLGDTHSRPMVSRICVGARRAFPQTSPTFPRHA
jgi:hypothetical protein